MMSMNNLFPFLLGIPLIAAMIAFVCIALRDQFRHLSMVVHLVSVVATWGISWGMAAEVFEHGAIFSAGNWLMLDGLSALFLAVLGLVALCTGIHSIGYIGHEHQHGELSGKQVSLFYGLFNLFLATMLVALTANNIMMMWVAIEATTVSSVFLVGLYYQRSSLEAAWKYIMLCSVGVAFGLFGTVMTYANAVAVFDAPEQALLWTTLRDHAHLLDPRLMQIAFIFIVIGFGTKTGLFPMHTWLPDAHSEAPSPVSGLLSAGLLNCALLIILRHFAISSIVLGSDFARSLMLGFGLLSVGVAALFILVQQDIKRLLAYSSVENMGLIAFAIGLGPLGIFAALLHMMNHSLGKTLMFCGAGNIMLKYGTRDMSIIKGVVRIAPWTGILFGAGALALGGVPPFNLFVSEFLIICSGLYAQHPVLIIILLLLLTLVLAGFARMVAGCVMGAAPEHVEKGEVNYLTVCPLVVLIVLMVVMGTHIPNTILHGVEQATQIVINHPNQPLLETLNLPWQQGIEHISSSSDSLSAVSLTESIN
ncbi:hydrogenase 4 subunit F [Vibrio spartinae]|uniref:Hydrogenase-4 component B n=1 Tax=Vibrio spartinae TaxID=1918945 RepID=A0A1N6M0C4_9VIBR|nr:hydrogenase 4 subunit F [Vibrio spartinae]QMV15648.1 Hydrogenase-4 component B [Vibrio spartinae]SIO92893.1 Hydrogenase-4 component B [Vibrio spartinae]